MENLVTEVTGSAERHPGGLYFTFSRLVEDVTTLPRLAWQMNVCRCGQAIHFSTVNCFYVFMYVSFKLGSLEKEVNQHVRVSIRMYLPEPGFLKICSSCQLARCLLEVT